jgi:hypothetical protein
MERNTFRCGPHLEQILYLTVMNESYIAKFYSSPSIADFIKNIPVSGMKEIGIVSPLTFHITLMNQSVFETCDYLSAYFSVLIYFPFYPFNFVPLTVLTR